MALQIIQCDGGFVREHLAEFVELLRSCVDNGSSVGFIAPLDTESASNFWRKIAADLDHQSRIVIAALQNDTVVGSVQINVAMMPNQPHRVDLQKLLVHHSARRQGLGGRLLTAAEDAARSVGRPMIVLDTEAGSDAERLYERTGYQRSGVIPKFALNFDGSVLIDAVFFYKML